MEAKRFSIPRNNSKISGNLATANHLTNTLKLFHPIQQYHGMSTYKVKASKDASNRKKCSHPMREHRVVLGRSKIQQKCKRWMFNPQVGYKILLDHKYSAKSLITGTAETTPITNDSCLLRNAN